VRRALLAAAGLLWLMAGASAAAPAAHAQAVRARQVAPDVWFVQGAAALGSKDNRNFISNAGFVTTGAGVVVIDALGSPAVAQALVREIRRITREPIRHVIVTHYHADHIYGLQVFKQLGAQIIAHESSAAYLSSDTALARLQASRQELAPWIDETTQLVPPQRWLKEPRTTLQLGRHRIEVLHVGPAHTPEDLIVHVPRAGALFAGDLVFRGRVPFVGQADSRQWIASLNQLIERQPRVLLPGHGPAATQPQADLELTRDYLSYLRQAMGEAARNLEPFEEAYARADWSRFDKLPLFRAANRINAYNTYLLMEQEAQR
jgi:glyoxylase-like metal-dependent hydrolase (beta-lactamase superfamily II)